MTRHALTPEKMRAARVSRPDAAFSERRSLARRTARARARCRVAGAATSARETPAGGCLESALLDAIDGNASDADVARAIRALVDDARSSLPRASLDALADALGGTWELKYSSKSAFDARAPLGRRTDATAPGVEAVFAAVFDGDSGDVRASSSPIQRLVLDRLREGGFAVRQAVRLDGTRGRVDQAVCFGDGFGWFRLSASARLNDGSRVESERGRIDYAFDLAYVDLKKPFAARLPYPVPFRLLGKEAEGFLTCDYVSERVRIATGNKGTTFVFAREPRDALPYADEFYA